jgi:hypothetical protein
MSRRASSIRPGWIITLLALLVVGTAGRRGAAQSVESDVVADKLSTKVHLRLGKTTLAKVTAALSEQTGLTIEPADYLLERVMVVQMEDVSARSVLNALSELNDWRWKETPDHTITIARHLLRLAPVPASISRMVQSAIPKDTRAFLSVPTPSENLSVYINPLLPDGNRRTNNVVSRVQGFAGDALAGLLTQLPPNTGKGAPIPFDKLSEGQQHDLIAHIAFFTFGFLGDELLSEFRSFVYDPESAFLDLQGTRFWIGLHPTPGSFAGFGWEITP